MVKVKAFKGLRPQGELIDKIASPPYDVLSSEEARLMADGNEISFLRVTKPEITLPPDFQATGDEFYERARANLMQLVSNGSLAQDLKPSIYVYRLLWRDVDQTGYVILSSCDDYLQGRVKRHEFTRPDKETDRTKLNDYVNAQTGPVFLFYQSDAELDSILSATIATPPVNDFEAADVRHQFWVIDAEAAIDRIIHAFAELDSTYVADGHHRCAAAANVCLQRRARYDTNTGDEPYAYFLSVIFPDNQLKILPYNRVVRDLNGHDPAAFLNLVRNRFDVTVVSPGKTVEPEIDRVLGMYFEGKWYKLLPLPNSFNKFDPIESLDVSILQKNLLEPILGITQPRTDKRIDFVGGIRGTGELVNLVGSGKFRVAFVVPPVSLKALRAVADSGQVMPPKSTWFEPKLRDGIAVYLL